MQQEDLERTVHEQGARLERLVDTALDRDHLIHPVAPWRKHEQRGVTVLESGAAAGPASSARAIAC